MKMIEEVVHEGKTFALVIRSGIEVKSTIFFTPDESPLQVGFVVRNRGYIESIHKHKPVERVIRSVQQVLYVQKGIVSVDFFTDEGELVESVELVQDDTIVLMQGAHSIRVVEDLKCLSVKQGPFLGGEEDKLQLEVRK